MLIERLIASKIKGSAKSLLLLGPRQSGKSTLLRSFEPDMIVDLSRETDYLTFASEPGELEARIRGLEPKTVLIDEVQRLPSLLNTIQALIDEKKGVRFLLSGSSARKLKRGQANLLPGRIHTYSLAPLCSLEFAGELDTSQAICTGTLPGIYTDDSEESRRKTLRSYSATYLKEEIQAEALTRNLEGFARFLFVAAATATEFLDFTKLASQAQVNRQSAIRYFEILEDTLIVHRIDAFAKSSRRRLIQHPKFVFFDNGVLNALLKNFEVSKDRSGMLFENLFGSQLLAAASALDVDIDVSTYRTEHGAEVDFIVQVANETWAIEAKASTNVGASDLRGFESFASFHGKKFRKIVAYFGSHRKVIGDTEVLPWQAAIADIFGKGSTDIATDANAAVRY